MRAKSRFSLLPVIIFAAIIFITFMTCSIRAFAHSGSPVKLTGSDTNFRQSVSDVLKNSGIKNAGITITKMTTDGYCVKYKVDIYLPKYIELTGTEEEMIIKRLSVLTPDMSEAKVNYSFSRERD